MKQEYFWHIDQTSKRVYIQTSFPSDQCFGDYQLQQEITIPFDLIKQVAENPEAEFGSVFTEPNYKKVTDFEITYNR